MLRRETTELQSTHQIKTGYIFRAATSEALKAWCRLWRLLAPRRKSHSALAE